MNETRPDAFTICKARDTEQGQKILKRVFESLTSPAEKGSTYTVGSNPGWKINNGLGGSSFTIGPSVPSARRFNFLVAARVDSSPPGGGSFVQDFRQMGEYFIICPTSLVASLHWHA